MSVHQKLSALALAAVLLAPSSSRADAGEQTALCFVEERHVAAVRPYYGKRKLGQAVRQPLRGAEVQLASSRLLDAEWIEQLLQQRLLRARGQAPLPSCLLDVVRVHIEPDPLSDGLSVKLIARDEADAEEVLRRAQLLLGT